MNLTEKQQDLWCELVGSINEMLSIEVGGLLEKNLIKINKDLELADLGEVDRDYFIANLHQMCFEWLHRGDEEVAIAIANNQKQLAMSNTNVKQDRCFGCDKLFQEEKQNDGEAPNLVNFLTVGDKLMCNECLKRTFGDG